MINNWSEFLSELLAIGPELTRHYREQSGDFIRKNPGTSVGKPGYWQVIARSGGGGVFK